MSAPEEIAPGVYGVNLGFVNAFFIADDAVTLVDTGVKARAAQIVGALKEVGRTADDIKNIALTHHHADHRGGLGLLRKEGVRLFVHPVDAQVVRGDRAAPPPQTGGIRRLAFMVLGPIFMRVPPATVDVELTEGDEIPDTGGLRAVHTPGHTLGHVSFLHPDKRVLFVGDAARNTRELANTPAAFAEDMPEARRTIAKIASLDFDTAVFGHGGVLRGKANAEFRKLADKLAAGT
jgi:glyoxylase-like metal-dependent hydrolase (beta-lactamase superfamily II)